MTNIGANVEAILTLDVSKFETGIEEAVKFVNNLNTSIESVSKSSTSFNKLGEAASKSTTDLSKLETMVRDINTSLETLVTTSKDMAKSMESAFKQASTAAKKTKQDFESVRREATNLVLEGQFTKRVSVMAKEGEAAFQQVTAGIKLLGDTADGVTGKMRTGLDNYITKLNSVSKAFKQAQTDMLNLGKGVPAFNNIQSSFGKLRTEYKALMSEISSMSIVPNNTNAKSAFSVLGNDLNTLQQSMERATVKTSELSNGFRGLWGTTTQTTETINRANTSFVHGSNEVINAQKSINQSNKQLYSSFNQTATATKSATTSYNQLSSAMNSLKTIGRTVASLFAYDIVLSLASSIRGTLQQKSEMEAFQSTMGMTTQDINQFNQALDNTVAKFGKLSKYNLGETVASLGVEFNLTNKQMEQAMDITAMLQSEYIRAGRTADEATLAVKDILQGEFVRLSRETGVGKGELVAAGWSGDTTDITTLMDALEKVATSRHWDTFAAKATSLNDVLQITRSRINDFAAEILDSVTPAVTAGFGIIANGLESIIELFSNIGNAISSNPWLDNIYTKLTLVAVAMGALIPLMVSYRTGATLIEMAQMGWTKSIMATILGINAETAANATSLQMIMSKITGYTAEEIATMGTLTAIKAKVLGLNAEIVAEHGLNTAIAGSVLSLSTQSTVLSANTVALVENELANASTLEMILAKIVGVNLDTVATQGLTAAIIEQMAETYALVPAKLADIAATEAETTAHLALAAAIGLTVAPVALLAAGLIALGASLYSVYQSAQKTADTMKGFNELVNSGDQILKNKQATIDGYKEDLEELDEELQDGSKSEEELKQIQEERDETQRKLTQATEDYESALKNVEHARSIQKQYDQTLSDTDLANAEAMEQYYQSIGMSASEAKKAADPLTSASIMGGKQMREAANNYVYWTDNMQNGIKGLGDKLYDAGVNQEKLNSYVEDAQKSYDKIRQGKQKQMTSDDWLTQLGGWGDEMQGRLELGWVDFWSNIDSANWAGAIEDFFSAIDLTRIPANWLGDKLVEILPSAKALTDVLDQLKGVFGGIADWISGIPDYIKGCIDNTGKWWDSVQEWLKNGLYGIKDWIVGGASNIWSTISQAWSDMWSGVGSWLDGLEPWLDEQSQNLTQAISDWWNGIPEWISSTIGEFDLLDLIGSIFQPLTTMDWLNTIFGMNDVSAAGGSEINLMDMLFGVLTPDSIMQWFNDKVFQPITECWSQIMSDPTQFITDTGFGIASLLDALFGTEDLFTSIWDWFNNSFIIPLTGAVNQFLADPVGYLGGVMGSIADLLTALFNGDPALIWNWINTNIFTPVLNALYELPQYIMDFFSGLWAGLSGQQQNAETEGGKIGKAIGDGLINKIREIPILGKMLEMLGVIPSAEPTANANGKTVGSGINQGILGGMGDIPGLVWDELCEIASSLTNSIGMISGAAQKVGGAILNGINGVIQHHSPGIPAQIIAAEMWEIRNAMDMSVPDVYSSAESVGQSIYNGIVPLMMSMNNAIDQSMIELDANANADAISQYRTDADTANEISANTVADSQMAFDGLGVNVGDTLNSMGSTLVSSYTSMNTSQSNQLNTMKKNNDTAYKNMQSQTSSSLNNMRSTTQNVTQQMTNAWSLMKNNIVTAAGQLKTQTNSHFNQLSSTIGSFYRKLQNPANWGGSPDEITVSGRPSNFNKGVSAMRNILSSPRQPVGRFAGGSPHPNSSMLSIKDIISLLGSDNKLLSREIDFGELSKALGLSFGSWSDWYPKHYNRIKTTSGNWDMKGPALLNYIDTGMAFKVKEFENGSPNVSWSSFRQMAEALFTAIPYDFYYNHDKTGDWVSALYTGSVNCVDGNSALLALAQTCGFSGHLQSGTWKGIGHVYAVINGQKMDATGWQQRRNWNGVAAGSPTIRKKASATVGEGGNTYNITVDLSNAVIYGVDDLEEVIEESTRKVMREEIGTSAVSGV